MDNKLMSFCSKSRMRLTRYRTGSCFRKATSAARGSTLEWIASFLEHRIQQIVLEGQTSSSTNVPSRVPQGTILGPLLFRIYIDDRPTSVKLNNKANRKWHTQGHHLKYHLPTSTVLVHRYLFFSATIRILNALPADVVFAPSLEKLQYSLVSSRQ